MKKKILSILLAALMVVSLVPMTVFAEAQKIGDSDVTWELTDSNTVLTLGGTGAMPDFTWLDMSTNDIPWYSAKDTITTVKVGSGITRIGEYAFFSCNNIENLYIEDLESWCKIEIAGADSYPFRRMEGNHNLYLNGNPVTDLVIPDTITEIKDYTFFCFNNLTSVTIPSSVTSIGYRAFVNCVGLTGITIPTSVTSIGLGAFGYCEGLTSVTIPAGVTSIGDYTFGVCTALTSVTIPTSVTSIGYGAFSNCPKLTSVTIPSSVTEIGAGAFGSFESDYDGCVSLTTVTVKATTPPTLSGSAFPTSNAGFKVYVPYGTLTDYQNAARWKLPTLKACLAEAYVVDDKPTTHGTVAMSKDCFPSDTYTAANETVTVTVTPAKGYALKSLSYYTTDPASATDITATKSFTMPKANVTVTAAFELAAPGTEANPWEIGTTGHKSDVTAYVKNNTLYVDGDGVINGFGGLEGFNASEIYDIVVKSAAVTGAEANAFADFGDGFSLTLPDGWLGELPDERGKWYGADQVNLTAFPNVVKNVTVVQRYPWNGNVEITAEAMGFDERTVSVLVYKKADGVWQQISSPSVMGDAGVVDLEDGKSLTLAFVWNSAADLGPDTLSEVYLEIKLDEITSVKTEAFDVDSRTEISLPEGETTVRNVWWSDTAWGAMPEQSVTIGWQNKTTGESGTLATNLFGTDVANVSLPAKDGVYALTHSVAGLTSFANYVVTGYPTHAVTNGTTDENGSISFSTVAGVEGETVTVTVTPADGYQLKTLTATPVAPTISTVADVLATIEGGFPFSDVQTEPSDNAWVADVKGGKKCYAYTSNSGSTLALLLRIPAVGEIKGDFTYLAGTKEVTPGENCYTASHSFGPLTFNMTDGVLTSFTLTHEEGKINDTFDGTYTPASTPSPRLKPITPEKQQDGTYQFTMPAYAVTVTAEFEKIPHTHNPVKVTGQAATETAAGWSDYYECKDSTGACHKYFEDATAKVEIIDLDAWKSQTGKGYIPSGNEINAAKTAAKAALDSENAKDALLDETALTNGKSAIDSAETLADIENAKNAAITAIQQAQAGELAAAKTSAKSALDTEEAKDPLTDKTALTNGKNSIDSATTKAAVEVAKNAAITAIQEAQATEHKDPKSPETGDTSNMTLWVMLLALSSMGLCACLVLGKKRKNVQ